MKKQTKNLIYISVALIILVAIFAAIVFFVVSKFLSPARNLDSTFNALKIPALLEDLNPDSNTADFVLNAQAGQTQFFDGLNTATLGYNGSYLGPVLRMSKGEKVNIQVNNQLNDPTTVHWHGLVVDGDQDGGPHQGIKPQDTWSPSFIVDQNAATLWFHPHLMSTTADQVYNGLAGLIFIEDEISDMLNIPKDYGINDFPLVVQDRSFNKDGSFNYQVSMMGVVAGDTILVNGTVNPFLDLKRENVRFRILNASNSQSFNFRMSDGSAFQQIASDGGFLEKPLTRQSIFLAPGERAEVIVDLTKTNDDNISLLAGQLPILKINLADTAVRATVIPESLTTIEPIPSSNNPITRVFDMQSMGINGTINGKFFDMDRIDEEVALNESEIWIIRNSGGMMQASGHPFHVHGTQFQVIFRNGETPPPEEFGFKDTVFLAVSEEVVLRVRFTHPGIFMYHCHILEHEDRGMMGQFRVQ